MQADFSNILYCIEIYISRNGFCSWAINDLPVVIILADSGHI